MSHLEDRYNEILKKVSNSLGYTSEKERVTLIAVSKKQPVDAIEILYRLGHRDFGENYVQELCEKAPELERRKCSDIRWHFIGHLQTNKVKSLIPYIFCVHTVDSFKLAQELAKRWSGAERREKLPVFIEVNLDQEESKAGLLAPQVPEFARKLSEIPELSLQGLMCIPAPESDPRARFIQLRDLEKLCEPVSQGKLSMGMSGDFELAIREGATHIRVGTALFGARS